ncbi:receptor-transporting protein 3-like [Epinephelus fuscoguttatus]|uniref:receptor-transporting protein 3-like n=1 Tax=Epinephelus fuscoguttatus TaxID=293821 RepID=UPI0020D01FFB|nr:receptor-transporting protein 3-like [Epinephelus fuscoguttatus]
MPQTEMEKKFLAKASIFTDRGHSWRLEVDESIDPDCPKAGWKQYSDNTSARFKCKLCPRRWPSNWVKVFFCMRLKNNQGVVKVRPYRQSCNNCPGAKMEEPSISSENIDILLENLLENIRIKCYGEDLVRQNRQAVPLDVRSSHEPDNCQGCKDGICGGTLFS